MAKYSIEDTTLTSIADAIREKAGTTGEIDTSQMAESILAIKGGLSLDVVTASDLPDTVVDGQIVVITDTTPGTVYIDTDAPAAPAVGDLWIAVAAGGDAALNLTEESPYLRAGITDAYQWTNSAWESLDGYIGTGSVWTQFAMAIPPVGTAFNDMTWEQISAISDKGLASSYFKKGDAKEIVINGKIGASQFANVHAWAFILGCNHNNSIEGDNKIHICIGKSAKSGGADICLVSDKYWEATAQAYFNMNTSQTTSGAWKGCYMRNTLLGNSGTPSAPPANSLMAALPSDLLAVIKACTKYTDNTGGSGNTASKVTATEDYIWFPSEFEIFGKTTRSNSAEQNYQKQYEYFSAGNSPTKYNHKEPTSKVASWTRSVYAGNTTNFCTIDANGAAGASGANYSIGICPCFCV